MDVTTYLLIIAFIYVAVFLLDKFYKTCAHYPYIQFLKNTGFEIKFFQIKWQTTAFNRALLRLGTSHSSFLNTWFSVGLNVTLIFLPIACVLILVAVYQTFFVESKAGPNNDIILPIIPGINLPASELGYYSLTLVISSIFHELGHAITAVKEDVHLGTVGINLLLILPIAFVSLNSEDVGKLHPKKALKIFCAGVWHNIALSLIAYLVCTTLPFVFSPLYSVDTGVIVKEFTKNSPLAGNNGLVLGDRVVRINNCNVRNNDDWLRCISENRHIKPGFCVASELITTYDESVHSSNGNCCSDNKLSSTCFEYLENNNGILEIPPHTCLPIRKVVEGSQYFCNASSTCPLNSHCIKPMIHDKSNILKINCENRDVIYLGLSDDLYFTLEVSPYAPKYSFLSLSFPDMIVKFFNYIVVFSMGLAVVNVIPCIAMDGHFISNALLQLTLSNRIENQKLYSAITLLVPLVGTFLFTTLVLHTLWVYAIPT